MALRLEEKQGIICGASDGIGAASAIALSKMGCSLTLVARRSDRLEEVRSRCSKPEAHTVYECDFSSPEQVKALALAISEMSGLDILVNNSGGPPPAGPLTVKRESIESGLETHLYANMELSKACVAKMKSHGYGRVVNIVSVTARIPLAHLSASNIARGAVLAWAKTLALEVAHEGITVNNVLPGYTLTPRLLFFSALS